MEEETCGGKCVGLVHSQSNAHGLVGLILVAGLLLAGAFAVVRYLI